MSVAVMKDYKLKIRKLRTSVVVVYYESMKRKLMVNRVFYFLFFVWKQMNICKTPRVHSALQFP
jgi:hypothetical protein